MITSPEISEPGEIIFESSNSIIYLQKSEGEEKPVILKILRDPRPSAYRIVQFNNEYDFTKDLEIPGIRRALRQKKVNDRYALILEYFDGIPLRDYFRNNRVSLEQFLNIASRIAGILGEIHGAGIIHRDIGGGNILINPGSGEINIIDFGISSLIDLRIEHQSNPEYLEGNLLYISPEQTGRMNRVVDYRTDLYSAGVMFYELLAGDAPFKSSDPMSLVYSHIARQATPLTELPVDGLPGKYNIPVSLASIIAKLMEKNAEDRYQSSRGLQADLNYLLRESDDETEVFIPGREDHSGRLVLPQKLYGRETELKNLLESFERVCEGAREMILVGGYSGVGKSALVHELHKPVTANRGYFVAGKFDLYQRNIPFYAFRQALNEFCRRLLSESGAELKTWKERILNVLGKNARVLTDFIPEIEGVIGPQPPLPELASLENKNRFLYCIQQFIQTISDKERSLVIFIDDLQWADQASLELLENLMSDYENGNLLIVGAYRENEVAPEDILTRTIKKIQEQGFAVHTLRLKNLRREDLNNLLRESLGCSDKESKLLGELVYEKTGGNSFFSRFFIRSLYEEGLIRFSHEKNIWVWDLETIKSREMSDNVVEFMAGKIGRLSDSTRQLLRLAACIGSVFELQTLAIIYQTDSSKTLEVLWEAIREGLILPLDQYYKLPETSPIARFRFLHDRVQHAAYSLFSVGERSAIHLSIGRLLLKKRKMARNNNEVDEKVFEIAGQLNKAGELITDPRERISLAELNLNAARKAKTSGAYQSAYLYLENGRAVFPESDREKEYKLRFELDIELGETLNLVEKHEESAKLLDKVLEDVRTMDERVRVQIARIKLFSSLGQFDRAMEVSVEALIQLGMDIPRPDETKRIAKVTEEEIELYRRSIEIHPISTFIDLPPISDKTAEACTQILAVCKNAAALGTVAYLPIVVSRTIKLALEHGLSEYAASGIAGMGYITATFDRGYRQTHELVEAADKINLERFQGAGWRPLLGIVKVNFCYLAWPINKAIEYARDNIAYSMEVGDISSRGYFIWWLLYYAHPVDLKQAQEAYKHFYPFLKSKNDRAIFLIFNLTAGLCRALMGKNSDPLRLDFENFSESNFLENFGKVPIFRGFFYHHKLKLTLLCGRYQEALDILEERKNWIGGLLKVNILFTADVALCMGIAAAWLWRSAKNDEQQETGKEEESRFLFQEATGYLEELVKENEFNFGHFLIILQAEKARIEGGGLTAIKFFDEAIHSARKSEYAQNEYLAGRLAGEYCLELGLEKFAANYLADALYVARRWGAEAIVNEQELRYGALIRAYIYHQTSLSSHEVTTTINSTSSGAAGADGLDISTVLKASQALSREINLEKLLTRLMRLILENAGARRGFLVLESEGEFCIEAALEGEGKEAEKGGELQEEVRVLQSENFENSQELCRSIVRYTIRSGKSVVLSDATGEINRGGRFGADEYIKTRRPRSILSMPVWRQDKVMGVLYLENNISSGAFTRDRTKLLNILLAQAAISLVNARVYDHLEELVKARTGELEQTHKELLETARRAGMAEVAAGVLHNVGNVLNSALTPASLLRERLKNSRVFSLVKLFKLLDQQKDLARFFTEDERGQRLPEYIRTLGETLEGENGEMFEKLERLTVSLQRIKDVIRFQEVYTGPRLLEEKLPLSGIIDSALKIESTGMDGAYIKVIREYEQIPPIRTDRHRVMLILMNLLSNARDSLNADHEHGREIRITLEKGEGDMIRIKISDNGGGIPAGSLEKIFRNGYTTKKDGHGFGLHSSANAAAELGGELSAHSDGPGRGASFILELPFTP